MVLCANCLKEGVQACMHEVMAMEGLEMAPREQQQHMHQQRQRWVHMSEDERRDRREQQRLWYRRRRSEMTDQEIALQNERRRQRYRLRRLQADAGQVNGVGCGNPMLGVQEGSAKADGHRVLEMADENWRREQQRNGGCSTWMSGQRIKLHLQERLYGQQREQVGAEGVMEKGGRQKQWRWKVEARKRGADTDAQLAHLNMMVRDTNGVVDGSSDDSETTETDESLQSIIPGRHCIAIAIAKPRPKVDQLMSTDEVSSKAPSLEATMQIRQPDACQAGSHPKGVRLTTIKWLAREMHSHSPS